LALAYRKYSTEYVDEEDAARAAQLGIWRGGFVPPWEWRSGQRTQTIGAEVADLQSAACCMICRKRKACGNGYINRKKSCHKPPGCACDAQ
jgi:hypothetical protein